MSAYFPMVVGDTGLRAEVEGLLDGGDQSRVNQRISELDTKLRERGKLVTFGAEVELQFVGKDYNPNHLYREIIADMGQDMRQPTRYKGDVIRYAPSNGPVMINESQGASDCGNETNDIIEVRTTPQTALDAVDLYWQTITSVGRVAARHNLLGQILATHVSTAEDGNRHDYFTRFDTRMGNMLLGATQQNLNALHPFQIDSGLGDGITVLEAYPSKAATTAVYPNRLEFRHPTVGITDPRIDILATLTAAKSIGERTISESTIHTVRPMYDLVMHAADVGSLDFDFDDLLHVDGPTMRLVTPAYFDNSVYCPTADRRNNAMISTITDGQTTSFLGDGEGIFRRAISGGRLVGNGIKFRRGGPHATKLNKMFAGIRFFIGQNHYRVQPFVKLDTPEQHKADRFNAFKSSVVRRAFGDAQAAVISADESIARRQSLIDNHMIVLEDE
jgi:hypothetical protein